MENPSREWRQEIHVLADRWWLAAGAMQFARTLGFGIDDRTRVGHCVGELVARAVRVSRRAVLILTTLESDPPALRIRIEDDGGGLADACARGTGDAGIAPVRYLRALGVDLVSLERLGDRVAFVRLPRGGARLDVEIQRRVHSHAR